MEIINKATDKKIDKTGDKYIVEFGVMQKKSKASIIIQIKGENLKSLTSQSDCSCSEGTPNIIDSNTIEIELIYKNTHVVNPFNKNIYLNFMENEEKKQATINIKGQIVQ